MTFRCYKKFTPSTRLRTHRDGPKSQTTFFQPPAKVLAREWYATASTCCSRSLLQRIVPTQEGTEEQYSEKERLLQEIADQTREFHYKYKAAAVRRAAPSRQKLTAAEPSDASALRDTAAATNLAYSTNGSATADTCRASTSTDAAAAAYVATSSVVEVPESAGNIWTTCVVDTAELLSAADAGETYEIVGLDVSRELPAAATGTPSIDVGGHASAASPEQTMEPEASRQVQRGKKRENENLIFF
ncbi:uncharacterized protein LOC115308538 isoform X2 [Ixodes scapularis]|uniref:uncharacterized protein LOC115308538 isoform X2 n=1 Tax=Ixodes scapularis TaxID=6945 RepID=UPI001C387158|nr:uncharacterized protein LOC115308538 isoform X2 [Ixodes scapularis]